MVMASASTAPRFLKSAFPGSSSMGPPPPPAKLLNEKLYTSMGNSDSLISATVDSEPRVLKSAFIPPRLSATRQAQWTRTCEMITVKFTCTTATYQAKDGLLVRFSIQKDVIETIQIAKEHESGDDVGFIGKGYTKRGIYVRTFTSVPSCYHLQPYFAKGTV